MAKFCTKCGKKLEEGKICDCSKNISVKTNTNSSEEFDFNELFNTYLGVIKGIFAKPASTLKKYSTSKNFVAGIIALSINILISGLFYFCFLSKHTGIYADIYNVNVLKSLFSFATGGIKVPFFMTFFHGMLLMILWFGITFFGLYVFAGLIMKGKFSIKESLALVGNCSIITTLTTILAIAFNYVNLYLTLGFLLVAVMYFLIVLYQGLRELTDINGDKLVFAYYPVVAVATIVMSTILFVVF